MISVTPPDAVVHTQRHLRTGVHTRVWITGLIGVAILVGAWELFTVTVEAHRIEWPPPHQIASTLWSDGWHTYWPQIHPTVWEAARGFFWGNLLAIVLAVAVMLVPIIERPVLQLSVVSYCLPTVAIASILVIVFSGERPKVIIAGMFVFFTTMVGTLVGLRRTDDATLDLITAYGGGRFAQLRKVRVRAALPSVFAALQIAAPASVLGAIIGEYIGHQDHGLGIFMVAAQSNLAVARTWGIALVSAAIGGIAYVLIGLVGRLFADPSTTT